MADETRQRLIDAMSGQNYLQPYAPMPPTLTGKENALLPRRPTWNAWPSDNAPSAMGMAEFLRRQGAPNEVAANVGGLMPWTPWGGIYDATRDMAAEPSVLNGAGLAMAMLPGARRISNPIRAYHGSPHQFDQFDMSRIGTGQGESAFGRGLYFSEVERSAQPYRFGQDYITDAQTDALGYLADAGGNRRMALDLVADHMRKLADSPSDLRQLRETAAILRRGGHGNMYEVDLHARPEQFLDWTTSFGNQSDMVQDASRRAGFRGPDYFPGMDVYQSLGPEKMVRAGIPGVRYYDPLSRMTRPTDTYIYSVFNPSIIETLRRYGIAAPLAGGAAASSLMGDDRQ